MGSRSRVGRAGRRVGRLGQILRPALRRVEGDTGRDIHPADRPRAPRSHQHPSQASGLAGPRAAARRANQTHHPRHPHGRLHRRNRPRSPAARTLRPRPRPSPRPAAQSHAATPATSTSMATHCTGCSTPPPRPAAPAPSPASATTSPPPKPDTPAPTSNSTTASKHRSNDHTHVRRPEAAVPHQARRSNTRRSADSSGSPFRMLACRR